MANIEFESGQWEIGEELAEELRNMFEGLWMSVEVVADGEAEVSHPSPEFDEDEDDDISSEEMEIYIVQSEDMPHRFIARYRRDDAEGEFDLRVLPTSLSEGSNEISVMFTFFEEDEIDEVHGSGFAMGPNDDILVGMMLYHFGPDVPLCWQRMTKELPEDLREMILFGNWDEDDEDEEFDFEQEVPFLIGGIQEILGGLFQVPEGLEEPDDTPDEVSQNPTREALLDKSLEEFLLFQPALAKQLEDGGIKTVTALLSASNEELLDIKGIGPGRLSEIRRIIHAWGLTPSIAEHYELDESLIDCLFRLKVTLDWDPTVWRIIELTGGHTMHELHEAIQMAFDWDDEHLYAFYMSGRYWDGSTAIEHPFSDGDVSATDIQLAGLRLSDGDIFVYLFDFGDELRHRIDVISVGDKPLSAKRRKELPTVKERQGDAPEQYQEWDEDWDEDE